MDNTRSHREAPDQRMRRELLKHIGFGRAALLAILAVSLLNQLLLLLKVNYHFLFSAAVPYYLNWIAQQKGITSGVTALKVVAVFVSLLIFLIYVACWMYSTQRRELLKTALVMYCADTVLLVVFAFGFLSNPFSCLFELLVHLVGIWLLYNAHRSAQHLHMLNKKQRAQSAPREPRSYCPENG